MKPNFTKKQEIAFAKLIDPIDSFTFLDRYWEKQSLIINRNVNTYYNDLFSVTAIDHVLDICRPTGLSIRIVKNQESLPKSKYENSDGSLNLNQIYAAYTDGYSVVINEIERYWPPLRSFCQTLKSAISFKVVANMYMTPKNGKALEPHHDTHDVFVLQLAGSKSWMLYDTIFETPLLNSFQPIYRREQLKNQKEVILNAGDMMYIPRGMPHEAVTKDQSSLHLTIGIYPFQWMDLLIKNIEIVANSNVELRRALPVGFLNVEAPSSERDNILGVTMKDLFSRVSSNLDATLSKSALQEEFRADFKPQGDGHFASLDLLDSLKLDSELSKRANIVPSVYVKGSECRIIFPGNVIKGPSEVLSVFRFVSKINEPFKVSDLPDLSEENKIKIAVRLIRGGLLKILTI